MKGAFCQYPPTTHQSTGTEWKPHLALRRGFSTLANYLYLLSVFVLEKRISLVKTPSPLIDKHHKHLHRINEELFTTSFCDYPKKMSLVLIDIKDKEVMSQDVGEG